MKRSWARTRGRYSRKRFERECLTEYSEVFPIVSGDFAFYRFPTVEFWRDLFGQAGDPFQLAFKALEDIAVPVFPPHLRYGTRAGHLNSLFLESEVFEREFLRRFSRIQSTWFLIMFEFPTSASTALPTEHWFGEALSQFFAALPANFRCAAEIRSPRLFCAEYFRPLSEHGIAHMYNSWTDMPRCRADECERLIHRSPVPAAAGAQLPEFRQPSFSIPGAARTERGSAKCTAGFAGARRAESGRQAETGTSIHLRQ